MVSLLTAWHNVADHNIFVINFHFNLMGKVEVFLNFDKEESMTPEGIYDDKVVFTIAGVSENLNPEGQQVKIWHGNYSREGKYADFSIEVIKPKNKNEYGFGVGLGKIVSGRSSDSSQLYKDLAEALGARKRTRPHTKRSGELQFIAIIFSENASMTKTGFQYEGKGGWTIIKGCFGKSSAEMYIALNENEKLGEFSPKDESYASSLLRALYQVF